jgi:hypothetical protein
MAVGFPAKTNFATGDVLTATNMNDITGTLNLLQSTLYPAGRNKVINGDFNVNQRNFTSTTTSGTYGFDRWLYGYVDGTVTYTPQTFTPGAAPVAGYEGSTFAQLAVSGQTLTTAQSQINQRIESVRTLAGQTAIMSFWARATSGTPKVLVNIAQIFGTGGSPSATVQVQATAQTISTSWARYEFTVAIPSISGKTLGTTAGTDYLAAQIFVSGGSASTAPSLGIQNSTFQIWGVQLESASTGSTASPFQTASGSIGGELALCQRYYFRENFDAQTLYGIFATGSAASTTVANLVQPFPVNMRVKPAVLETPTVATNFGVVDAAGNSSAPISIAGDSNQTTSFQGYLTATCAATLTQFRPYVLRGNNTTGAYLGWSAEL